MKLSTVLLPLILGAAAVDAKVKKAKATKKVKGTQQKFCYRDGVTAIVSSDVVSRPSDIYDYDAALAWIDLGHFHIEDDEALLVEATVETLFFKGLDLATASADHSVDLENTAGMRAAVFKGCTTFDDCMTQGIYPIDPKPSAIAAIKVGELDVTFVLCFDPPFASFFLSKAQL